MHLVDKNGVFIAMKGDIEQELTESVERKISTKYIITKRLKFTLPYENSKRCLLTIKNKK